MKKLISKYSILKIIAENIKFLFCLICRQYRLKANNTDMLETSSYNLSTAIPLKLWKTFKNPVYLNTCIILLSALLLFSCNPFKSKKPDQKSSAPLENAVISMTEAEVKKRFGEPDIVSKTPENNIIWTYRPQWKVMPDNKGTFLIEFENGKVIKIIKGR